MAIEPLTGRTRVADSYVTLDREHDDERDRDAVAMTTACGASAAAARGSADAVALIGARASPSSRCWSRWRSSASRW